MPYGHDQCIFYVFKDRIFEFGLYGENVNTQEEQGDKEKRTTYKHERAHCVIQSHPYAQIAEKYCHNDQEPYPYEGRLTEIFTKGFAEVFAYIAFTGAYALHTAVIEGSGGSADGKDGKTVDDPENVQSHKISYKIQKTRKCTVIGK